MEDDISNSDIIALFARYFGWTVEDFGKLTRYQIDNLQQSILKIIRMENGSDSSDSSDNPIRSPSNHKNSKEELTKLMDAKLLKLKNSGVKEFNLATIFSNKV